MEGQLLSGNFGSSLYTSFVQQTIVCQRVLNIGRLNYMHRPWGTVCTSMCVGGRGRGSEQSCNCTMYEANTFKAMHVWPASDPRQPSCMCGV